METGNDFDDKRGRLIRERIQRLCLFDDEFMTRCFDGGTGCVELVLRIVLGMPGLSVRDMHVQHYVKNLQGRSVFFDVRAVDDNDREYDIEVQRDDRGACERRARYNSSVMDANALLAGDAWDDLPETYVVMIAENDVLRRDEPVYHIDRRVAETGEAFDDGAHIVYVNGAYRGDDDLGRLMHDFACTDPAQMHYAELADRVRYFKEDERGVASVSKAFQDIVDEVSQILAQDLAQDMAQDMAKDLAQDMAKDLAQDLAKDMAQGMAQDIAQGMAEEMAEGMARDMAQDLAKDMAKDIADERQLATARRVAATGKLTPAEIASCYGVPLEEAEALVQAASA